jgi:hypothetical protein
MFFKKPFAMGYPMTLTKLKIGAAAPDFPCRFNPENPGAWQKGFNPRTPFLLSTSALPDPTA